MRFQDDVTHSFDDTIWSKNRWRWHRSADEYAFGLNTKWLNNNIWYCFVKKKSFTHMIIIQFAWFAFILFSRIFHFLNTKFSYTEFYLNLIQWPVHFGTLLSDSIYQLYIYHKNNTKTGNLKLKTSISLGTCDWEQRFQFLFIILLRLCNYYSIWFCCHWVMEHRQWKAAVSLHL